MKATTSGSTVTGPAAAGGLDRGAERGEELGTCGPVAALTERWMVGGVPAYDICGWTYQSRAAISSQTVNASQLPSVTSAISVDCG